MGSGASSIVSCPFGWHLVLHFDAAACPATPTVLDRLPTAYVIDHMGRVDAAGGLDQEPFALSVRPAR